VDSRKLGGISKKTTHTFCKCRKFARAKDNQILNLSKYLEYSQAVKSIAMEGNEVSHRGLISR